MTRIAFEISSDDYDVAARVRELVANHELSSVADLGAGANPVFASDYVRETGLDYTLIDISDAELSKAGGPHQRVVADVTSPNLRPESKYDLVVSRWLLEHLDDPRQFHRNVFAMLNPGGFAFHFFPTLYSPPFVANRILPEAISKPLLGSNLEGREKFPAHYRWCRGPTARQIKRLTSIGFSVEEYVGFFGHDYFAPVRLLHRAEHRAARLLARHPLPSLTSFASVTLRKPHFAASA